VTDSTIHHFPDPALIDKRGNVIVDKEAWRAVARGRLPQPIFAQDYDPNEPRAPAGGPHGGEWTRAGVEAVGLVAKAKEAGGFSYSAVLKKSPQPGQKLFAVSYSKDTEKVVPLDKLTPAELVRYARDHWSDLHRDGYYLGGWVDSGKCYLDCSIVTDSEEQAVKIAQEHDQLAYFSFESMTAIDTPKRADHAE
jgi:hypothetical protein